GFMIEGVQGPMARSVRDCAMFMDAMAAFDPNSPISYPGPKSSFQTAVIEADTMPRIAFAPDLNGFAQVDDDMATHIAMALDKINRYGAVVVETCPDFPNLEATYHTLRGAMWATAARRMPEAITQHFKKTLADNTAFGRALTMDHIADAHLDRTIIYANMLAMFDDFDVLACPVVGCMPHPQTTEWVDTVGGVQLSGYMDWLRFAFLATTTGLPAMSVPVGRDANGVPVGLQLIGKPRGEADLLAAASMVERVMGGPMTPIDPITPI
ncbi:MAG: amidase family protein, partial [Planktomarina sp.]